MSDERKGIVLQTGRYHHRTRRAFVCVAVDADTGIVYRLGEIQDDAPEEIVREWEWPIWRRFVEGFEPGELVKFLAPNTKPCRGAL